MSESELIIILFHELSREWLKNESPIQIGSDLEKIEIMEKVRPFLPSEAETPPQVVDLYQKVYLRNVWKRC